jgi:uncharacterized protein YbjT (DUF2867 family)
MQRIFVTGGTGFVGHSVVRALVTHGFLVRCLVRPGSEAALRGFESIDRVPGDLLEPENLARAAEGSAAMVHLVGIIREQRARGITFDRVHRQGTENAIRVAREAGIPRLLHMSALGTRAGARSAYHRTKWRAEEAVRASGLDWTIFRPSIIFGVEDEFISTLAGMVRRLPAVPVLGDGRYRLQPIPVEQVAQGFTRALRKPASIGQTYEVGGPEPYPFVDILDQIGLALGRKTVRKIHVPLGLVKAATRLLQWLPAYPVSTDQLTMLEEESVVADPERFFSELDVKPESLAQGLRRMLANR